MAAPHAHCRREPPWWKESCSRGTASSSGYFAQGGLSRGRRVTGDGFIKFIKGDAVPLRSIGVAVGGVHIACRRFGVGGERLPATLASGVRTRQLSTRS